jgi:hypothetical protein
VGAGPDTPRIPINRPPSPTSSPPPPLPHHHHHTSNDSRNQNHGIKYHSLAPGYQDRDAFGVIVEAMRGRHIFTSSYQVGMIMSIFMTWGAPLGGDRDLLRTLPHWSETFPQCSRPMRWDMWGAAGEDLLDSMLSYDRHKRATVAGVSGHAFFQVPARKGDVPP